MLGRLVFGVGLFAGSLAFGWWLGRLGVLTNARVGRVIRLIVKWLSPMTLGFSFWRPELANPQVFVLPLIGFLVACSTLPPAFGYASLGRLTRPQQGSFLTCAMFSNIGFLGAIVAFALFGELAYSLAMLYVIYFDPCFYMAGFTVAKRLGRSASTSAVDSTADLRLFPLAGLCAGLLLAALKVARPPLFGIVNHALIPLSTSLYLMAIGSQLHLSAVGRFWRPALVMSAIKFCYSPLVGWWLAGVFHLEGLPRSIVLLQSCMPVATSPLILPMIFGLDQKLSGALWLTTTLLAAPVLFMILPLILR